MQSKIYTYALIRCLFNKNEDYIDTFWPFIVNVLPTDKSGLTLEQIQSEISDKFKIFIPIHSLGIISTRAARKNYITRDKKKCSITDKGLEYINKLESERDESRRVNELIDDAKQYLLNHHKIDIPFEEVESIIELIIKQNLEIFEQFIGENGIQKPKKTFSNNYDNALIDYLFYVEKSKPNIFKTLQDIIFGSIISTIVNQTSFEEYERDISSITVVLDANYLFSLLGLHYSEQCKPAKELYDLMKGQSNIDLKVFDFTVEEMTNVLKKFHTEQYHYPAGVKIDSIYSSMKANGYQSADVRELLVKLENKLWDLGIKIFPTKIDLNKYEIEPKERRYALEIYKKYQGTREQNHDLAAIEIIRNLRSGEKKKIEDCSAMFLTSDLKLGKFNYHEDGHKAKMTITEVIPDKLFTNILWLKNPKQKNGLHLSSWISLHTRNLFIDRSVWSKFYENLKILRDSKQINDLDISILLYDNHMQEILRETDPSDVSQLEGEKLLESLYKAKERLQTKHTNEIEDIKLFFDSELSKSKKEAEYYTEEVEKEYFKKYSEIDKEKETLEERLKSLEQDKINRETRILDHLSSWKKKQELETENNIDKIIRVISFVYIVFVFFALYFISDIILMHWNIVEPYAWLISMFLTAIAFYFGIKKDSFSVRAKIREKLFNKMFMKRLKQIEEVETLLSV